VLDDLSDDALHDRVWSALIDLGADDALGTLPQSLVTYWTTQRVDYEVGNGGFLQLFHNSSSSIVDDAAAGFARLGLDEHLALLRQAMEINARPEVEAEIERIWSADDNLREFSRVAGLGYFDHLDHAWFALPPAIDVGLAHLRRHASEVEAALHLA